MDAKPGAALQLLTQVAASSLQTVELDAAELAVIQPVGVCLLANAARYLQRAGKRLLIRNASHKVSQALADLAAPVVLQGNGSIESWQGPMFAMTVASPSEANAVANRISQRIAEFIPAEDRVAMLQDRYGVLIHHAVQPALAHILSELLDNVFSHARTVDHPSPMAWLVTQWYSEGDLVRVAVVDDGCGLLASLRGLHEPPKNHFEAAGLAFKPFVSSKNIPSMYAERRHMGLGLTVCRDICQRLGGCIYAISGNAWVANAGLPEERRHKLEAPYQGTIVSLEFHRRAATTRTIQDILTRYQGVPHLRARFS
ncbi:ATP-binding protein [Steroidobacter cummioxidans]|uniref:ATP-binding protein n=1 Tax=Steroidobacter cummioxidans TaxID=1803913 RepID=UPI000E3177F6|nr:ATP-binding protein [Steroidobacter cummioxidans]